MRAARRLTALLITLAVACSDSGTGPEDPGPGNGDGNGDGDPNAETYCGRLGYPCSIADVDPQVAERSDALLDDVMTRTESGESIAAVAAWLEDQDGVAHVAAIENGIVYQVAGGLPMWFFDTPIEPGATPIPKPVAGAAEDVVGHGTPRERMDHTKKAIVVAPFLHQFGSFDSGPAVSAVLSAHKEYAGGVQNRTQGTVPGMPTSTTSTGTVTVADFQGWTAYDVIVLSTHGGEMSEGDWGCGFWEFIDCIGAVATGERVRDCGASFQTVVQAKYADLPGVRCGGAGGAPGKYIYLDTDFFVAEYPVGLDKAVIYFGACKSSSDRSTATRLAGSNSDFFGWDNDVVASEEMASARRLFQVMITNGATTTEAFRQLEFEGGTNTSAANMLHSEADDGLYIREITNLKNPLHPSVSGGAPALITSAYPFGSAQTLGVDDEGDLKPGDILPFFGQSGDGENDQVFFYVDVDGIRSGRESEFDVTVTINQQELGTFSLDGDDAERIDDYTVRLRIQQELDFDVQEGTSVTLRATTNLPGDDDQESWDEVSVTLANPVLHIQSQIETSGGDVEIVSEVEGEVDLRFERGDQPDELKLGMSVGPLQYKRFEVNTEVPAGCSITTETHDGRIQIYDGNISFEDPNSGDFGVPDDLAVSPLPEITETMITTCSGISFPVDLIHWYAGFASFHGGQLGGANELDPSRGFVITNWQSGTDGVYARKVYNRSGTEEEVTLTEDTTLEIRGPDYTPASVARVRVAGR